MQDQMDDKQLLALVNSLISKNLEKQQRLNDLTSKANNLFRAISYQSNYVQNFKEQLRSTQNSSEGPIYFDELAQSKDSWIYFKLLSKAKDICDYHDRNAIWVSEKLSSALSDDNEIDPSQYDIQYRINKATNQLTADMAEYSEQSSSGYKKRQRYQLSKNSDLRSFRTSEDQILLNLVKEYSPKKVNWRDVTLKFNNSAREKQKPKSLMELYKRYRVLTKSKEVVWTPEEDELLKQMVQKYGTNNNWFQISMNFSNKNSYQCILQYKKHEDNNIKKGKWTPEEDKLLLESMKIHGEK